MNLSTIYRKTTKGARALVTKSKTLPSNSMRVLSHIDGKSNAETIMAETKLSESKFILALSQLLQEDYIGEVDLLAESFSELDIHTPIVVAEISAEEFHKIEAAAHGGDSATREREQKDAEARAKAFAEEQLRLEAAAREQEEAERKLLMVTDILAKSGDRIDIEKLAAKETEPTTRHEQKIRDDAEARNKAETAAKTKRELAAKARADAERKTQEDAEARAKRAAEIQEETATRAKREAEARAQAEAERKTREEADSQAKREANEKTRLEAELKAREAAEAQAKRDAAARAQAEAERKAREEAEAQAKREAEEKARLEAEAERTRQAAEQKAREEAKAEAEAKARAEAEAQAKREAEEKARLEAEAERARQAAEQKAREEAKAQAKAEAEAKARAEAEARAIREAKAQEKRAAEARARAEAKRLAKEEAKARKQAADLAKAESRLQAKDEAATRALIKAEEKTLRRAERGPVDIQWLQSTIAASRNLLIYSTVTVFVAALILLVALHLVNLSMLIDPIEKLASENINEPVVIKEIHASLWPQPQLVLDGVSVGTLLDIKATTVHVRPVLATIFDEAKALKSIEIEALALDQDNVNRPLKWISFSNNRNKLKIDQISLNQSSIKLNGVEQPVFFNSDIALTSSGKLKNAKLYSDKHTLAIEVLPQNDTYEINVTANEWQPPLGAKIMFDELSAKGVADNSGINFSHIEGKLYGGDLKAKMAIHWADQWAATGSFEVSKINLEEITLKFSDTATLKGHLNSSATFSFKADDLAKLVDTPEINANFEIANGHVDGIDLVRAMQVTGQEQAGGSTRFEKISGRWVLKDRHYQLRQLALKAGQLQARGDIDISADQSVSGKIATGLTLKSRQLQSRFSLSGKLGSVRLNQ
jgi:hypothetical protein